MGAHKIPCKKCGLHAPDAEQLRASLREYVDNLPEDVKTTEAEYERRLAHCFTCEHHAAFTCRLCGCYVQMRAVKWRMSCPDVNHPRWGEARSAIGPA